MAIPTYDDVNLILRLYDMRREEKLRTARDWFVRNFKPKTFEEMGQLVPMGSQENAYYRQVSTYWEMVASFLVSGVLNHEIFFQSGRELLLCYVRIKPILPALREFVGNPAELRNLEIAALDYMKWWEHEAPGAYEKFVKRIGG